MRILADDLSSCELLTPEKTESVLEEVEGHPMFPIQLPLEDEDRMELFRTTLVIQAFTNMKDSYQSLQRTVISSCQQMLTKTLNTKLTAMSICSTYGQGRTYIRG